MFGLVCWTESDGRERASFHNNMLTGRQHPLHASCIIFITIETSIRSLKSKVVSLAMSTLNMEYTFM